ncbi:MAG TPA: hypothetical protein VNJ70_09395 [Thermoanaerobaculia bacterium]|nr:hypothetical protein [Thermoanaerobaculia bacterium]
MLEAIQAALSPDESEQTKLATDLASLHNEGLVDLIDAFAGLTGESTPGPDFFFLRHVLEELLPELEAPVPKVSRCVLHLYREGGADWAAGTILNAFRDFCAKRADRSQAALAEIEGSPEVLADLLVSVLVAGSVLDPPTYVVETIRLSQDASIDLRRRALFALGRLHGGQVVWSDENVMRALEHAVEVEGDGRVLASCIQSAFALSRHDPANEARWLAVIASALSKGGEIALHAASEVFGLETREVSPELVQLLLEHWAHVDPSNTRTLKNIDRGVAHLLQGNHVEAGLGFLEDLLRAHPEEIELSAFRDSVRAIRDNPAFRSKIATRWLIGGEAALCKGLDSIVDVPAGGSLEIEGDSGELVGVDRIRLVFAARKAIGYLFQQPISATSFLLSLMRQSPDARTRKELEALLLNPLLLNLGGSVAEYVARRAEAEGGEIKAALDRALKALENYIEALRSVGEIPAFHPSLEHRDAYHRHFSEKVAQSFKKAEAESVLLQLVHRSVLLYGRKAIHHVFGAEGEIHRMETQLGSHGTEIEVPRMMILDPHGLDFMLRVFRHERMSL